MTAAMPAPRQAKVSALMRGGRARPRASQPLSAQFFRRPAPAHRHRARPGARPRSADLRRAGLRARRFGPGADPQPSQGSAEGTWAHLSVHFAQSGGRRLHGRPHRGDVRRPHRRARAARDRCCASRFIPIRASLLAAVPFPDLDRPLDFETLQDQRRLRHAAPGAPQFRDDGRRGRAGAGRSRRRPFCAGAPHRRREGAAAMINASHSPWR